MPLQYWLGWFDKEDGGLVGDKRLEGVDEREFIEVFEIQPDQMMIDSFPVGEEHRSWLEDRGVPIDLDRYDFFIAVVVPSGS
jgi:hypothetical protein